MERLWFYTQNDSLVQLNRFSMFCIIESTEDGFYSVFGKLFYEDNGILLGMFKTHPEATGYLKEIFSLVYGFEKEKKPYEMD